MLGSNKIVALVTARSKSKGLKNKNMLRINGLSLIQHVVLAAKKSKFVDDVYISSDSVRYIKEAQKKGADSLFIRPKILSGDNISSMRVISHFLDVLKSKKKFYDYLVLLEPTSPMTSSKDIDNCLKSLVSDTSSDSIVGISRMLKYDLNSIFTIKKKNKIKNIKNKIKNNFNRFNNDELYFLDGSIYISKVRSLIKNGGFISNKTKGYIFPYSKSFEIDNQLDFKIVKHIFKK